MRGAELGADGAPLVMPEQRHIAHIDDNFPSVMPSGWAVGSFIFLTDVPVEGAGAFTCFPGSPARFRVRTAHNQRCLVESAPLVGGAAREMLVEAGTVVLVHHIMGHCGSTNFAIPTTRHAFFPRWKPTGRVVPGFKPYDQMSTLEKANSARYIQAHLHPELPLSPLTDAQLGGDPVRETALREGIALAGGKPWAVEPFRYNLLYFVRRNSDEM